MRRRLRPSLSLAVCALLAAPASAQSSDPFAEAARERGPEARLSLRIPFGNGERNVAEPPQLELSIRRELDSPVHSIRLPEVSETRLGFALSSDPVLLLDGQPLPIDGAQADAGAGRTVVDGFAVVGLAVVATGVVFLALDAVN